MFHLQGALVYSGLAAALVLLTASQSRGLAIVSVLAAGLEVLTQLKHAGHDVIVFEVLDVDGSNLSRGSSGNTLSADPPTLETERLLSFKGDVCSAPNTDRLATPLSPRLDSIIARSSITPAAFRAHVRIVRREAAKDSLKRTFSPSPADPA